MSEFSSIKLDAIDKLNEAQKLAFNANQNLADLYQHLGRKEKLTTELSFIVKSLKNHLQIFESLKKSISMRISDTALKKDKFIKETKHEILKLQSICKEMKSLKVNSSLLMDQQIENPKSLFDYINSTHMQELISEVDDEIIIVEKLINSKIMDNIIVRFQNESNYLYNEWESIESFHNKYIIHKENEKQIDTLIQQNSDLEMEIVSMLKQLNQQFDNCVLYEKNQSGQLYQSIHKEQSKSKFLLYSLQNNCDIISQNCKDVEKLVKIFDEFKNKLVKCFNEINEFSVNVLEKQVQKNMLNIEKVLTVHFSTLNHYKDEILQLSEDFLQFIESYFYLILEIDRRSTLNNKVEKLIDNFESGLQLLQEEDKALRNKFLSENADFLPQDLVDFDIMNSRFPSIELNYSLEQLPKLNQTVIEQSIKMLKQYRQINK